MKHLVSDVYVVHVHAAENRWFGSTVSQNISQRIWKPTDLHIIICKLVSIKSIFKQRTNHIIVQTLFDHLFTYYNLLEAWKAFQCFTWRFDKKKTSRFKIPIPMMIVPCCSLVFGPSLGKRGVHGVHVGGLWGQRINIES